MNIADCTEPYIILERKDFKDERVYEDIRSFMREKEEDTKDHIKIPIDQMRTNARHEIIEARKWQAYRLGTIEAD